MEHVAPVTAPLGRAHPLKPLPAPGPGFEVPPTRSASTPEPAATKTAIAFEAVVLRTFVEAMLPKEGFGDGTAGHMWRGQMADALAGTLAESGGIGIADALRKDLK